MTINASNIPELDTKGLREFGLTTGAIVAVLFGLGLVVWELQQAREIAKIQSVSDAMAAYSQRVQAMMGEESAVAVARACDEPDSLTTEDMIVLAHFYTEVLNNMRWHFSLQEVSDDLAVFDWQRWSANFANIFATEYGRWWWQMGSREPEITEVGNRILADLDAPNCSEYFDTYRNRNDNSPR